MRKYRSICLKSLVRAMMKMISYLSKEVKGILDCLIWEILAIWIVICKLFTWLKSSKLWSYKQGIQALSQRTWKPFKLWFDYFRSYLPKRHSDKILRSTHSSSRRKFLNPLKVRGTNTIQVNLVVYTLIRYLQKLKVCHLERRWRICFPIK